MARQEELRRNCADELRGGKIAVEYEWVGVLEMLPQSVRLLRHVLGWQRDFRIDHANSLCVAVPDDERPTAAQVEEHFREAAEGGKVSVRLLERPAAQGGGSRGMAFVELASESALHSALKLHKSVMEGRRINVERTVGGGGATRWHEPDVGAALGWDVRKYGWGEAWAVLKEGFALGRAENPIRRAAAEWNAARPAEAGGAATSIAGCSVISFSHFLPHPSLHRGYAMLEDICPAPGCNSPLMQAPGAGAASTSPSSRGPPALSSAIWCQPTRGHSTTTTSSGKTLLRYSKRGIVRASRCQRRRAIETDLSAIESCTLVP